MELRRPPMAAKTKIAIQLGRRSVQLAVLRPGTFGSVTAAAYTRPLPEATDPSDAKAVGAVVASIVEEAGAKGGSAVFALPRSLASTKRFELPSRDPAELPEMVRLAMQRDLPIDSATAEIDFVATGTNERGSRIFAVAVPGSVVRFQREVAAAAGVDLEAISLRCLGTSHLVGRLDPEAIVRSEGDGDARVPESGAPTVGDPAAEGPSSLLAVDIGGEDLELSFVGDGLLKFARGVELQAADSSLLLAETISSETRRTWLSYRISQGDEAVAAAVVLGGSDAARLAVPQLAASTGLPSRLLRQHPDVRSAEDGVAGAWPLVGLLLERRRSRSGLDLAHPKRPPDLAKRRRVRLLAQAALVIVAGFGGWTVGRGELAASEDRANELEGDARKALSEFLELKRERLRLGHLEAWRSVQPGWLDHALAVESMLESVGGDDGKPLLDTMQGSLDVGTIRYARNGAFEVDPQVRIVLEGESADRAAGDALRDLIVADDRYQLRSTGADAAGGKRLPIPFSFQLRTGAATGEEPEKAPDPAGKPRDTAARPNDAKVSRGSGAGS